MIDVEVANRQQTLPVDEARLIQAVRLVLGEAGIERGSVSIAIVTDAEIHALNRKHLQHDYPTDVLSFLLEQGDRSLEGEIVASAETAAAQALQFGWSAADELLLYVIHGALHLVGHDDQTATDTETMRRREAEVLARFGLAPRPNRSSGESGAGRGRE